MARARNIKPSFFQNEELGELSPITRLAFIGMWTIADFKGCIEFRPKRLKIQLLPYDNCDLEEIAINLDKSGLIRLYSVQGQQYIKIINFEKHQNPHKNEREAGSEIPDYTVEASVHAGFKGFQNNPEENGTAPADSLFLIPSSLTPLPERRAAPRASRLPQEWTPSPDDLHYCKTTRPDLDARKVAENFRDYWLAKAGKDASKMDWSLVWKSWVRKESAQKGGSPYQTPNEKAKTFADRLTGNHRNGHDSTTIIDITPTNPPQLD